MSIIDIFIAFMVLTGLWRGFHAGAIKTAMSLVAWLVALIIASTLAKEFAPLFVGMVDNEVLQVSLAFLVITLVIVSLAHLISWIALKTLKLLKLGFLDNILGGILGAGRGVLKVLIILSIASPLLIKLPNWQESILAQNLLPFAPVAQALLTEVLGEAWDSMENPYEGMTGQ